MMLLVIVIEGKHLKTGAFSAPWCMKKGKGGLCQKRNVLDSVNKLQYFLKDSLVAGNNLTSAVLLYFLKAMQVSVAIHTNTSQPVLEATC